MKEIDDIFKEKLFNYQKTPTTDVFLKIKNNYPKANTKPFWKSTTAKIIFSSIIITTVAIITILFIPTKQNSNDLSTIYLQNSEQTQSETNTKHLEGINSNKLLNNDNQDIETYHNDKISVKTIKTISFFEVRDTNICGLEYTSQIEQNYNNIILPKDLELYTNNEKISFVASKSGKYIIKYKEVKNNTIFVDSMTVSYKEFVKPELNLSNENLCSNQILKVELNNPKNYKINWDIDANIKKVSNSLYEISGLKSGKNNIKINYSVENCNLSDMKIVTVSEIPKYTITSKSSYCSGANAEIAISLKNIKPEYFMLDNLQINKTGKFNNLTAGIHNMQIKYTNGCISNDTIFIFDSLKIKPYFKSQSELIDKNKYFFNNLTEIDSKGYEKNKDIEFTWKINDLEVSNSDNLSYMFTNNGIYNVKLIAIINNECVREYSEKIEIFNNNDIKIPNIFTPNGDGIGDYFQIVPNCNLKEFSIIISGKNGETVFESRDIDNSWDGKIYGNNDAPEGLYYYSISAKDSNGNQINKNGTVQLIRK